MGYSLGDYPQEEQRQRIVVADVVEAGKELIAPYTQFGQSFHSTKPPEPPPSSIGMEPENGKEERKTHNKAMSY